MMASDSEQTSAPAAQSAAIAASPKRPRAAAVLGWAGLILAALGWWLSLDLVLLSENKSATNPLIQAQCGGQNPSSDCLSVLRSERAKGPLGIPWAALGMGYFAFVGVWYAFIGVPNRAQRRWLVALAVIVACGLLASLQLIGVMAVVLRAWCVGCLFTHGVNAALGVVTAAAFFVGGRAAPLAPHPAPRLALATLFAAVTFMALNVSFVLVGRLVGAVGTLTNELLQITQDADYIRLQYAREPTVDLPLREDEPWLGDAAAPNTVVAFVDFQCAVCRSASQTLADAVQRHPGRLRVAYRHFPQDAECNPHYPDRSHPAACGAARAAQAALLAGGVDDYHRMRSLLYQRQRDLELNRYGEWAAELGLDSTAFNAAMSSEGAEKRIQDDTELGGKLGVTAVPVLYLNGKRLSQYNVVYSRLRTAI